MRGALVVIAIATLAACSERPAEFAGVGNWKFTHTTLQNATGRCQPTDLDDGRKATWCFGQTPYKIGKHVAEVDLYFLGTEPTAPLIEIQLKVRGCDEDELTNWMRTNFGAPIETRTGRGYWKNSFLWAAALLPDEPGRCTVHFLPPSEQSEITRLHAL